MSRMNNLMGLLKLLRASGNELETRIRIQKEAYLLSMKFPELFNVRDFEYHYYGPYSRGLSETLQFAVSSELIDEVDESPNDDRFTKFRYILTDKGASVINDLPDSAEEFVEWATRLNSYSWRALELASTAKYLEMNEELGGEAAFNKALDLKPGTVPHAEKARELLHSLHS